jgi:hypothetical protein
MGGGGEVGSMSNCSAGIEETTPGFMVLGGL